jgi:hypothetical protein
VDGARCPVEISAGAVDGLWTDQNTNTCSE